MGANRCRAIQSLIGFAVWLSLPFPVAAQESPVTWPREFTDPAGNAAPADLVLPMPCGAQMAFQRVDVPLDATDPLSDRRMRLGQSGTRAGYADYLRPAYLRGSFRDDDGEGTYYFVGRYELTRGQYRALKGDCEAPDRKDRLAQGNLSWFEAVDLARTYTEWLLANAQDRLPRNDGAPAFVRLPTETEWEYAARGGARTDDNRFPGLTFLPQGEELRRYARHQAPGAGRGRLGPVGVLEPNPLGLFDVYGNAEEIVLDLFRLNALGRDGGQPGGMITRGGSVLSLPGQIYSAQRTEYPPFSPSSGLPLAEDTFGVRFVLSTHIATSDAQILEIAERWNTLEQAGGGTRDQDPDSLVSAMIDIETDPRRAAALEELQLELRRARDRAATALQQSARATLLAGAVFVETLSESEARITAKAASIRMLVGLKRSGSRSLMFDRQLGAHLSQIRQMRQLQATNLLSYRAVLDTLAADIEPETRETAFGVLREELILTGQHSVLDALDRFRRDLERYSARPDMTSPELLTLALD